MATLILIFCLSSDQTHCVEQRPIYEEPLSMTTCMIRGQFAGAEYVRDHPEWRLAEWRCAIGLPRREGA